MLNLHRKQYLMKFIISYPINVQSARDSMTSLNVLPFARLIAALTMKTFARQKMNCLLKKHGFTRKTRKIISTDMGVYENRPPFFMASCWPVNPSLRIY